MRLRVRRQAARIGGLLMLLLLICIRRCLLQLSRPVVVARHLTLGSSIAIVSARRTRRLGIRLPLIHDDSAIRQSESDRISQRSFADIASGCYTRRRRSEFNVGGGGGSTGDSEPARTRREMIRMKLMAAYGAHPIEDVLSFNKSWLVVISGSNGSWLRC